MKWSVSHLIDLSVGQRICTFVCAGARLPEESTTRSRRASLSMPLAKGTAVETGQVILRPGTASSSMISTRAAAEMPEKWATAMRDTNALPTSLRILSPSRFSSMGRSRRSS